MGNIQIRKISAGDKEWAKSLLEKEWGSVEVVSRGKVLNALDLPGFVGEVEEKMAGLVTYHIDQGECEIVTLNSLAEGRGMGTKLIAEVKMAAKAAGCKRVWLITTNDNMKALNFYQKRGFVLAALYPNALAESRKLKPEIPEIGIDGIPLRDEIELEVK